MKRWLKVTIAGAACSVILILGAAAPRGLRRMDSFRVRRVEVRGTHFLPPHQALSATGITRASNVFDDFTPWRDSLVKHPLVNGARIERELPGTIRIFVEEAEPIAMLADKPGAGVGVGASVTALVPVSVSGEQLPIDPSSIDLDLPIVFAPTPTPTTPSDSAPAYAPVLRVLAAIKAFEPAMYGWISDAELVSGLGVRVRLRSPAGAQAMIPLEPQPARLRQLRLTLADLAGRQDISRLARIDARFQDQIVVTLTSDRESPEEDRPDTSVIPDVRSPIRQQAAR